MSDSTDTRRSHFAMLMDMADDDLDSYQYRQLGHFIRKAGAAGVCEESLRETAAACKTSINTARRVRAALEALGYLIVQEPTRQEAGQGIAARITVIDRWAENADRYKGVSEMTHLSEGGSNLTEVGASEMTHLDAGCIKSDPPGVSHLIHPPDESVLESESLSFMPDKDQDTDKKSLSAGAREGSSAGEEPEPVDPRPQDVTWGLGMVPSRSYGAKASRARSHPLVKAWRDGFPDDARPPVHDAHLEIAERMAGAGVQAADLTALVRAKTANGKLDYPLLWAERDLPGFVAQRKADAETPRPRAGPGKPDPHRYRPAEPYPDDVPDIATQLLKEVPARRAVTKPRPWPPKGG